MRRLAAAVLAVMVVTGCGSDDAATTTSSTASSPVPPVPSTAPPADDLLGGFVPAAVEWQDCDGDRQCGTLDVPLDWSDPGGDTIELALARVPAGDDDARLGVLVTNPGGPGASGIDFVTGGGPFAGTELAERFDVVSWDPRGVGGSTPLACGEDEAARFWSLDGDPDDPGEAAALDDGARAVAEACGAEAADLLPHVGTDAVAFDLEAIRRSLGQPLAYYGFSYGTLIGLRYAELFPEGATRIVLDGVVDPTDGLPDLLRGQATAFERIADDLLAGVEESWDRVAAAVEDDPIPAGDGRELTPADLLTATTLSGYDEGYWRILRDGLAAAEDGDGSILVDLADQYWAAVDFAAYQAVSCVDSEHPVGADAWTTFADELAAISPRFGRSFANEMRACAHWPAPPDPVVGPVRAVGAPPILVIGTTGDAATPVEQAEQVAAGLADGRLLVYEGRGHTAFTRSDCVEDAAVRYLVDGELPAAGARC